jgi:hypothetical protein
MKYFVIATKWDSEKEAAVKYIAGEFDSYMNASLFRDAYNKHYSAHAKVVEAFNLVNA